MRPKAPDPSMLDRRLIRMEKRAALLTLPIALIRVNNGPAAASPATSREMAQNPVSGKAHMAANPAMGPLAKANPAKQEAIKRHPFRPLKNPDRPDKTLEISNRPTQTPNSESQHNQPCTSGL